MKLGFLALALLVLNTSIAAPTFTVSTPDLPNTQSLNINSPKLCNTAKNTLAYLNRGYAYDPAVIHSGHVAPVPLSKIKATLVFICQHQDQMNNPTFVKEHFNFIRWSPDLAKAKQLSAHKPLLQKIPSNQILMTKYYVHLANASTKKAQSTPFALYALPKDEQQMSLEEANSHPELIRFKYGKQAVLKGALPNDAVTPLAFFSRADLESALLQGTVVADFNGTASGKKIFNVHRNNNIAYDRTKGPYEQERFWYFKEVDGIKGYGKDADQKITVDPEVTFAADLNQLGLGKLLMIQYRDKTGKLISRAGIFADTGGAFADNLYQVDFLAGSFAGNAAFAKATHNLPDYVNAYFMVLKD